MRCLVLRVLQNQEPNELRGHTDSIHSIAWDPTNPWRLASTGADKTVRIWDVKTCKIAYSISLQSEALNIVYSYDGKYIAVSNLDCVMLIDTRKNRVAARVVNPYEVCTHAHLYGYTCGSSACAGVSTRLLALTHQSLLRLSWTRR